jgi:short-subunit dehydrogenase
VITGASSGIGLATAHEFARHGYNLVLVSRRKKELEKIARELNEVGADVLTVPADTTDDVAVHQVGVSALDRFGHINVWINAAGVYIAGKFQDIPHKDMRRVFDINFFGYVNGSETALEIFRAQASGTLINVASLNSIAPQPYVSIYSASKAAVRSFSESLRMELRLDGFQDLIHVCTVMPAAIDTNIFQNSANYTGHAVLPPVPVYDPAYVARKLYGLTLNPKRELLVGQAAQLLALQHVTMPGQYEKQMAHFTEAKVIDDDTPVPGNSGNLFAPIEKNRGMRGGWREDHLRGDMANAGIGLGLAALSALTVFGFILARRGHSS